MSDMTVVWPTMFTIPAMPDGWELETYPEKVIARNAGLSRSVYVEISRWFVGVHAYIDRKRQPTIIGRCARIVPDSNEAAWTKYAERRRMIRTPQGFIDALSAGFRQVGVVWPEPHTEMSLDTAIAAVRDMALAGPDGIETADKVIAFMEHLHAEAMS